MLLLYVAVVVDVILAVAMVAGAAGAVAEFQLGIGNIGSAAYGAAVGVGRLCRLCGAGGIVEVDMPLGVGAFLCFLREFSAPGQGEQI